MKSNIKKLRTQKGITQEDFAGQLGISVEELEALENSDCNPPLILAKKISKLLDCSRIEDVFIFDE